MERYLAYVNGEINDPNGARGNELADEVAEACDYIHNPEGLQKWLMNLKISALEREAYLAQRLVNQ